MGKVLRVPDRRPPLVLLRLPSSAATAGAATLSSLAHQCRLGPSRIDPINLFGDGVTGRTTAVRSQELW